MGICRLALWTTCLAVASARSVEELPTLKQDSQEVLYKLNQPFKLECGIVGEPKQNVEYQWLKDDSPVSLNSKTFVPDHRKESLVFLDPTTETEGRYVCEAKTNLGVASSGPISVRRTYIDVPEVETMKHVPVEGEMYQLNCPQVDAYPKPITTWYLQLAGAPSIANTILERHITTAPNGNLYFAYVTKDDVSDNLKYVCVATHPALEKPVVLAEHVDAYPKPITTWYLQLAGAPSIANTILERHITTAPNGNLYFAYVTKDDVSDNFKYVCVATHPALEKPVVLAEHVIESTMKSDGDSSKHIPQYLSNDMTVYEGDVTLIYCIYGGSPLASPDWYFEDTNVNGNPKDRITRRNRSSGKRLLIRDTRLTDTGRFSCKIPEIDGSTTTHEMRLNVVSPPKFVNKPESITKVKQGQDITIPCQIRSHPASEVSWSLNTKSLEPSDRASFANSMESGVQVRDLVIKGVQKSDSGYYGCRSENDHGVAYLETLLYVE